MITEEQRIELCNYIGQPLKQIGHSLYFPDINFNSLDDLFKYAVPALRMRRVDFVGIYFLPISPVGWRIRSGLIDKWTLSCDPAEALALAILEALEQEA